MQKKYCAGRLLILIGLILFFYPGCAENVPVTTAEPLSAALQATGAEPGQLYINAWAKLPPEGGGEAHLASIVRQVMTQLGFDDSQYRLNAAAASRQQQVKAVIEQPDRRIEVFAGQINAARTGVPEVYLVINLEMEVEAEPGIRQINAKFAHIIETFGSKPQITTCLVGWLDGKLGKDERDKRLADAFAAVDAQVIQAGSQEHYSNFTGFSPLLDSGLKVGSDRFNFQAAVRYSGYDNRTYVLIGSPLITIEY